MKTKITIEVKGHVDNELHIEPFGGCGDIKLKDGVCLSHGDHGVWVVRFEDLKKAVEICELARRK